MGRLASDESVVNRRTVLKSVSAAGAGIVGAGAATETAEGGAITGDCVVTDWPSAKPDRIDLSGDMPVEAGEIPADGDVVIYVHGLFGQDILDSIDINGANQAEALDIALTEQGIDAPVVAGMWNSTTTWTFAKWRADSAGKTLARWVEDNYDRYDSIVVLGHSLGSRVTLAALNELADSEAAITSAGLLGAGVNPDTVCEEYESGIENGVEESVYNYHSTGDRVVCYGYAILEWSSGLGCRGSDCSGGWFSDGGTVPDNFVEVDLSDVVDGHCNFYKPESMEYAGDSGVPHIVNRQFDEDNSESESNNCWLFC